MVYFLLILMVFTNAGETIGYKCTKSCTGDAAFGVAFWSAIISLPAGLGLLFYLPAKSSANFAEIGFLCLLSVLGVLTVYCWAKASKHLPMSIAEGVSEVYIALLAIVCWIFFGQALNGWQIGLICAILVACLLLAVLEGGKSATEKKCNPKIGFVFLGIWVLISVIKGALPSAVTSLHPAIYLMVQNYIMLLICGACIAKKFPKTLKNVVTDPWLMVVGFCRVVSQLCVFYLASRMNLGVADAVSVCGLVIIMLFERLATKERINPYCYPILLLLIAATAALCAI